MSDFPSSVLIACSCGFAAEGRLRTTCEGARFWFGRCVGCGRDVMAKAPSSLPGAPATSSAAAPFHVLSASTGPRGAPPPPPAGPAPPAPDRRAREGKTVAFFGVSQAGFNHVGTRSPQWFFGLVDAGAGGGVRRAAAAVLSHQVSP